MKLLITADTFAPSMDGPVHLPAHSFADLELDSARAIVQAGKGLYIDGKDDPTKTKQFTAPAERVKEVVAALAAAEKAAKADAKA